MAVAVMVVVVVVVVVVDVAGAAQALKKKKEQLFSRLDVGFPVCHLRTLPWNYSILGSPNVIVAFLMRMPHLKRRNMLVVSCSSSALSAKRLN